MSTGLGEIYEFYLQSKQHSPMELRTLLDWVVGDQAARGARASSRSTPWAARPSSTRWSSTRKRLAGYRLSLGDIESILEQNNAAIGAGYIEKNRESFVIRADAQFQQHRGHREHRRHLRRGRHAGADQATWARCGSGRRCASARSPSTARARSSPAR